MSYQLTANGIFRMSDSAFIPQEPANRDWLEYQEWLLNGGEVLGPDVPLGSKGTEQGVFSFLKRII